MFIVVKRRFKSSFFCITPLKFILIIQISRIFGTERAILRAFQTFLRLFITLEKLRAPKDNT